MQRQHPVSLSAHRLYYFSTLLLAKSGNLVYFVSGKDVTEKRGASIGPSDAPAATPLIARHAATLIAIMILLIVTSF